MIDKVFIDRHWLPAFRQACLQRAVAAHELCWSFVTKMYGDGLDKRRGERRGNFTGIVYIERFCTNVSNEQLTADEVRRQ